MSFFALETRDIDKPVRIQAKGHTQEATQQNRNRDSFAPFGSLSSKKNKDSIEKTVGPGHYAINRDIVAPSVSKYENRNIIIVKINDDGGHQFKSRTNRFVSQ